jgi:hypothetical protein
MVLSKRLLCLGSFFQCVNAVTFFEPTYVFSDGCNRARSISAKHVRKCGFDSGYFDKSAFTLIRIPRSDAGSFDANQNLVRFYLGDG